MVSASGAAIFTVVARDAASAVMGKIGKSMGSLQNVAGTVFKSLVAGAAAVAAAFLGIAAASIKAAMDDQKAQARMVATLEARGLATKDNLKAIQDTIIASQKYGQTDDDVRKSIETATQYTKSFTAATKISAVATQLAAAKGMSLEEATAIVGKAYRGNGKALKQLGIDLKRTGTTTEKIIKIDKKGVEQVKEKTKQYTYYIKGQAALNLVLEQYGGIADAVAATPAAKLEAAQIRVNEAFESFGAKFLPGVADAIDWFSNTVIPVLVDALDKVDTAFTNVGDYIRDEVAPAFEKFNERSIKPIAKDVGILGEMFGKFFDWLNQGQDQVPYWDKVFARWSELLAPIQAYLDAIIWALKQIGLIPKADLAPTGPTVTTPGGEVQIMGGRSGLGTGSGGSGAINLNATNLKVTLGKGFVTDLDAEFGAKYIYGGGSRVNQ